MRLYPNRRNYKYRGGSSSPENDSANHKRNEPMNRTTTYEIDPAKEPLLRTLLESAGFSLASAAHAFWRASDGQTTITFYKSGKLVLQGESHRDSSQLPHGCRNHSQPRPPHPASQSSNLHYLDRDRRIGQGRLLRTAHHRWRIGDHRHCKGTPPHGSQRQQPAPPQFNQLTPWILERAVIPQNEK